MSALAIYLKETMTSVVGIKQTELPIGHPTAFGGSVLPNRAAFCSLRPTEFLTSSGKRLFANGPLRCEMSLLRHLPPSFSRKITVASPTELPWRHAEISGAIGSLCAVGGHTATLEIAVSKGHRGSPWRALILRYKHEHAGVHLWRSTCRATRSLSTTKR